MRRRRWARSIGLAVLLHHAASCGPATAQERDGCEEVTASSVVVAADYLSLDRDQLAWLLARFDEGRLREPADLGDMPGMGSALRDALVSFFCWSPSWEGRVEASVRGRADGPRREGRARFTRAVWDLSGRFRWDAGADPVARGGLAYDVHGWSGKAGTLHVRRGLGLLLATPGAEPRGSSPIRPAASGWRPSVSLDPEVVTGFSVAHDVGEWYGEAAWVRGNVVDEEGGGRRRWWGTLDCGRRETGHGVGLVQVFSRSAWSLGLHATAAAGTGEWSAEWAWGGEGTAQGAVWSLAREPWRFRAGLTRVGAGYRIPSVRLYRAGSHLETVLFRLEIRRQSGAGRFVRLGLEDGRGAPRDSWGRIDGLLELEVGERIRPGTQLVLLWRARRRGELGSAASAADVERTVRGELDVRRRLWRARVRLEERISTTGRSRMTSVRFGRAARTAWEVRSALVVEDGVPPDVWWYGRRAGGLYGWDRLPTGTWMGAWVRVPWGRWSVEMSADARRERWDWIVALRLPVG